jgi:Rnl2 family RNA ligase
MNFQKYPSIENSYREKFIQEIQNHPHFPFSKWQVTEKIHGSNFSFISDGNDVKIGKRSGFTDGSFYNCYEVLEKYRQNVLTLFNDLGLSFGNNISYIQLFGELFGPGVQKGVEYGGEKDFRLFDIVIKESDKESFFLSTDAVELMSVRHQIPHVPIIESAVSFEEAMKVSPDFDSLILGKENNKAEGVVIKPIFPMFLNSGSRIILKNKNEAYKEKANTPKPQKQENWSESMNSVFNEMLQYNTEERIRSAISKIGQITQKDFGKLLGTVSHDLLEDWEKEYSYRDLSKNEIKVVNKQLNKEVSDLIRKNFVNIIDGVF